MRRLTIPRHVRGLPPNDAGSEPRRRTRARATLGAIGIACGACSACLTACADDAGTAPRPGLRVTNVAAAPNPLNALSLVVTFDASSADSARVVYERSDGVASTTPFVSVTGQRARVAVLGLEAERAYRVSVEARGAGTQTRTDAVDVVTGKLPDAMRTIRFTGDGQATSGYTLVVPIAAPTDTVAYVVAFDATGRLAWYREFIRMGWAVEAKQQPNDHITVYLGRSYGWQLAEGHFVQLAPDGEIVRTFAARSVPYTDPHELRLTLSGETVTGIHLLGYRMASVNLSALGGPADTALAVHVLERQSATGQPVFAWDAAESYSPADWPQSFTFPSDLVHPSAFAIDRSGDYVVSLQAVDEIANVDARTGAIRWRFGGARSDFTILNDPLNGFRGQHGVQVLENGNLLFLDNRRGAVPSAARAVEYALDTEGKTARLVWEFRPNPAVASPIMGSVQRLANGNTVVGFAVPGRVMEVDRDGRVVAHATLTMNGGATQFYRAIRIASLDSYTVP